MMSRNVGKLADITTAAKRALIVILITSVKFQSNSPSSISISLVNLLRMRPTGVVSKKETGDFIKPDNMFS